MQWLHVQNVPDPLRRCEDKKRISMNYKPDLSRHQASSTLIRGQGGPWGLTLQASKSKNKQCGPIIMRFFLIQNDELTHVI